MLPETTPRDPLLPNQTIPTNPNANFNRARRQRATFALPLALPLPQANAGDAISTKIDPPFAFGTMFEYFFGDI
jgi:hypothetical protein